MYLYFSYVCVSTDKKQYSFFVPYKEIMSYIDTVTHSHHASITNHLPRRRPSKYSKTWSFFVLETSVLSNTWHVNTNVLI